MNRLIKHIAILILSLPLLLIGCTVLDEDTPIGGESGKSYLAVNVEDLLTRGSTDEMPTVKSIRLLVFGEKGEYFENRKVAISSSSIPSIPLTLPTNVYGKNIYVYAILNEDGSYCSTLESGVALSTELAKFTNNSGDRTAFLNLMNQPLKFNPANADASAEKIFLMYAKNENVLVNSKATQDNPFPVNLSETEDVPRSMAKITIESINGDADADAAKVFVTDVRIENIPTSYSLSGENAGTDMTFADIAMGKGIDYTDRNWNGGIITGTYAGSITEKEKTDDRCYSLGGRAWSFSGWPTEYKSSDIGGDCAKSASEVRAITEGLGFCDFYPLGDIDLTLDRGYPKYFSSATPWKVSLGQSVYVPENKGDNKATQIVITLMIKEPTLSGVTKYQIAEQAELGGWDYYVSDGYEEKEIPATFKDDNAFKSFFERDKYLKYEGFYNNKGKYRYYAYLCGFMGKRTSEITDAVVDSETEGVTAEWTTTTTVKTFTIPVNNQNVDGDYSIKRNHVLCLPTNALWKYQ